MPTPLSEIEIIMAFVFSIASIWTNPAFLEYFIALLIKLEKIVVNESLSAFKDILLSMELIIFIPAASAKACWESKTSWIWSLILNFFIFRTRPPNSIFSTSNWVGAS